MSSFTWNDRHPHTPHASFHGGDLDCGSGLLLLIRKHLDPLLPGQLLEVRSTERSVVEDLPAWCRLTGNLFVSAVQVEDGQSYLIRKAGAASTTPSAPVPASADTTAAAKINEHIGEPPQHRTLPPFAVCGIGSWPRPRWLMLALHEFLEARLSEADFHATADDAVRLAVSAQVRAGVDLISDGEQRRDGYASFVGSRLDGTQLVPVTDLLPYVDDPKAFAEELKALDVPAEKVRHPAVLRQLRRTRPLARHELDFTRTLSTTPVKVALPGPYLLTRTLWLDCITERPYPTRETLADDVVAILRAEIADLLGGGAAIVQLDEPVLTEVVFGKRQSSRQFMCGALGERKDPAEELEFASGLLRRTLEGFPRERLAMHVCRGNWSRDERVALAGDYRPLLPLFQTLEVGTLFLELCTPRAGELEVLAELPTHLRVGIGVVNPKRDEVESVESIVAAGRRAAALFGAERLLLTPDCGFATFADNPVASAAVAEAKLAAIAAAATELRRAYDSR